MTDIPQDSAETLGRDREISVLAAMLGRAADGEGAALVLHGDPGIGKSTLLARARQLAAGHGMKTLACSGVPAEANLPFAGLHQLLWPEAAMFPSVPDQQGDLLRAALGLDESLVADLYRVAMATLELLSSVAAKAPLLVVADDVHWLDRPSASVLAFVARRIAAEPIVMLASVRSGPHNPFEESGLPGMAIGALDTASSRALLDSVAPGLPTGARDRLLADAAGNPLALVELGAALPAGVQPIAAGLTPSAAQELPGGLPVGDLLRRAFTDRLAERPAATRILLLMTAADPACSLAELCAAATEVHGVPVSAADIQPAIDARQVHLSDDRVVFRHPLIASAIYQSAGVGLRQQAHAALARLLADPDRRAWHLAAAALGPDDAVAAELEALAARAARRGAVAVSISALGRAAALARRPSRQADLAIRASEYAMEAGRAQLAQELLSRADAGLLGAHGRARLLIVQEGISPGQDGAGVTIADLTRAARAVTGAQDRDLAAAVLWTAATRCWWTSAGEADRRVVADAVDDLGLPDGDPRRLALLTYTVTGDRRHQLSRDLRAADHDREDLPGLRFLASTAENLGDHAMAAGLLGPAITLARRQGRLGLIPRLLALQAWATLWSGDLDTVTMIASEASGLAAELGQPAWGHAADLESALITGLRGDYQAARGQVWGLIGRAGTGDVRLHNAMAVYGLSVAALGAGRYQDAYDYLTRLANPLDEVSHYGARQWIIADLTEAAIGAGRADEAAALVEGLAAEFRTDPTPAVRYAVLFADALLAPDRFGAVLSADPGGGQLTRARVHLAHGSWLRRQRRVPEARIALARAQDTFGGLGMGGFAGRAAAELRAAGVAAAQRRDDLVPALTPQELQIARLAADGQSNRQIGEQLYLSHRTVGSHLYHIFPKLGITRRSQLPAALHQVRRPEEAIQQ